MSATETLAQFIVDTEYDRLPGSVVEAAKITILDGVANLPAYITPRERQPCFEVGGRCSYCPGGPPNHPTV